MMFDLMFHLDSCSHARQWPSTGEPACFGMQVRAHNSEGASPWSEPAHATQQLLPALPPSSVAAELRSGGVNGAAVRWAPHQFLTWHLHCLGLGRHPVSCAAVCMRGAIALSSLH